MDWYLIAIIVIIVVLLAYYAYCTIRAETLNVNFSTVVKPDDKDTIRAALRPKDRTVVDYVSVGAMGNFFILRAPSETINACVLIPDIRRHGGPNDVNIAVFSEFKNTAYILDHKLNPVVGVKNGEVIIGNTYNKLWQVRSVRMQRAALPTQFRQFAQKGGSTLTLHDAMTVKPHISREVAPFKCVLYRTACGIGGATQQYKMPTHLWKTEFSNVFYSRNDEREVPNLVIVVGNAIYVLDEYGRKLTLRPGFDQSFDDKWAASAFSMRMKV